MSMTWDKDAIYSQGKGLGAEFKGKGMNVAYAPTVQPLGRSAWGGRSGESYGPDSYLSGIMAGRLASGMVASGVTPSAKHYILNEQETNRQGSNGGGGMGGGGLGGPGGNTSVGGPSSMQRRQSPSNTTSSNEAYSAAIGDKAFHETYLAPFYDAVKAGVGGAMCSMQKINGSYGCENQDTLARYLRSSLDSLDLSTPMLALSIPASILPMLDLTMALHRTGTTPHLLLASQMERSPPLVSTIW